MLRLLLLLAALFALAPAARGEAAGPSEAADNLRMTVRPGLDGAAKLGAWLPVEVQVSNTGADLTGEIQIQIDGLENRGAFNRPPVVYSAPAVLPRQSSKRFVLEVFLVSATDKISARLVSGGNLITQAEAPFERIGQNELFCGVLSGNRTALDFLPGVELPGRQRHMRIAHLDVVDLPPSPQMLSSLDCLILSNISLAGIAPEQKEAIHSWTAAGGLLVVAGGPGWQKTVAGLPADLLPVQIAGTVPLRSARGLEQFFGQKIEDPGPWLAADARPTDGAVVLAEDGLPLIVAARRGQGAVVFLALDPGLEPLRSWRGSAALWRHLAGYAPAQLQLPSNVFRQYTGWGRVPRNAMSDLSPLRPPAADLLPGLLLLYGAVVGPLAYLGLRRIGRLEWLLWIAPLATAVATGVAFSAARSSSESDVLFNKITLVRAWDMSTDAYARTYVAAFSPRQGTYEIDASGRAGPVDALVFPMFYPFPAATGTPTPVPVSVQRGGATSLTGYALDARSLGTFQVDSRAPIESAFRADLRLSNGQVSGRLVGGPERIGNAALIVGGEVVRLGDIAPGETRQIAVTVPESSPLGVIDLGAVVRQLYPNPSVATPVSNTEAMSREIIDSALSSSFNFSSRLDISPVSLVGWLDRSPLVLRARNARATELDRTLVIATLPVGVQPGEEMRVPTGLIDRRSLISGAGRVSQSNISLNGGEALMYEYLLPQRPDRFAVDELALDLSHGSPPAGPFEEVAQLSIYDWPASEWRDLPVTQGVNPLGDPARVVSALGQVRLRLTYRPPIGAPSNANLNLDRFDLVVRGRGL